MPPRRFLVLIVLVCGLCAVLIAAAARVGSSRPEMSFVSTPPRADFAADYSVDIGRPRTAPLSPDVIEAAALDTEALGLLDARSAEPADEDPQAASALGADSAGVPSTAGDASRTTPAEAPAADAASRSILSRDEIPVQPTLIGLAIALVVLVVAFRILRPAGD